MIDIEVGLTVTYHILNLKQAFLANDDSRLVLKLVFSTKDDCVSDLENAALEVLTNTRHCVLDTEELVLDTIHSRYPGLSAPLIVLYTGEVPG